jgi:hypothetical protein
MTWAEFKTEVLELASEIYDSTAGSLDGLYAQACAQYVRSEVLRELHTDDGPIQTIRQYRLDYRNRRRKLLGYTPTFADDAALQAAVRLHLTADADRDGANEFVDETILRAKEDMEQFGNWTIGQIKQGVLDLQDYIPALRLGQETTYESTHFVTEGYASKGQLPDLGEARQLWTLWTDPDSGECTRHELKLVPWEDRYPLMIENLFCEPQYTISPNARDFWITPIIADENWEFILRWDGTKMDFADGDFVPFGDEVIAKAVSDYIRASMALYESADMSSSQARAANIEYQTFKSEYAQARTRAFLRTNRRRELNWAR